MLSMPTPWEFPWSWRRLAPVSSWDSDPSLSLPATSGRRGAQVVNGTYHSPARRHQQ